MEPTSNQSSPGQSSLTPLRSHSCALCHKRKVKCDKKDPCTYCVTRNIVCVPVVQADSGMKKRRFPEAELLARLRRYEAALKSFGADVDALRYGNTSSSTTRAIDTRAANQEPAMQGTIGPALHVYKTEGAEQTLKGCSEDDDIATPEPIFATYDLAFETYGSPLVFSTSIAGSIDLPSLQPSTHHILQLWQTYLDNVHPLLRAFHAPSLQQQLFNAINNMSSLLPSTHALLFSIYSTAMTSMRSATCLTNFGEDKHVLISKFQSAARFALHKSGFLRYSDRTVLSATVLCLISMTRTVDPRLLLCMIASAERCARRNGYHLNLRGRDISSFEVEMRSRLWWQIVWLQGQVAEAAVAGPSSLSWDWQVVLPRNVNESDITPEMSAMPLVHQLPTDMLFCIVKYEILEFRRRIWASVQEHVPNFRSNEFKNPMISVSDKLKAIDSFQRRLESQYFSHCDPTTALFIMTQYYVTYSLSKMRIAAYTTIPLSDAQVVQERQEKLMKICIEAIEAYTSCFRQRMLDRFHWFLISTAPFLAYVHLLYNLRRYPTSMLASRGWSAISSETDGFGRPRWIWGLNPSWNEPDDSAMALAFANMTVKAWEAREKVSSGSHIEQAPALIMSMKEKLNRSQKTNNDVGSFNEVWPSTHEHRTELVANEAPNDILQVPQLDPAMDSDFTMLNDWGFGTADDYYWGVN